MQTSESGKDAFAAANSTIRILKSAMESQTKDLPSGIFWGYGMAFCVEKLYEILEKATQNDAAEQRD